MNVKVETNVEIKFHPSENKNTNESKKVYQNKSRNVSKKKFLFSHLISLC